MNKNQFNLAVVGATGTVGNQILACLNERKFPLKSLKLLASQQSAGKKICFEGELINVEKLTKDSFKGVDIAFFSAGSDVSKKFIPFAGQNGCIVIDNSNAFRMDPDVPLVVPEVNSYSITNYSKKGIISNPNCSTIQMVVPLYPIHKKFKIKRIVVSTYQAVSGTGKKAINELLNQVQAITSFCNYKVNVYPHRIAFNCLPHIDIFLSNSYTREEMKIVNETKKIFGDDTIKITATAVRIPVFHGHSESVNIETYESFSIPEIRALIQKSPGVKLVDNPEKKLYPLAINAAGDDLVLVGRIRRDESISNGINMWVVADNVRKGAATNAVQIAEILIKKYI